ncbi:HAD family hydrolase [Bacillota bacterium LX-D]|nr:HAD family hydrolase [Bacillota bacterium LX-D]
MFSLTNYKHIIWDWNGTLLDDLAITIKTINRILNNYHLPAVTKEQYLQIFDFPVRECYEKMGLDFTVVDFKEVADSFAREFERLVVSCNLQAGAIAVLEQFARLKIPQSMLSATYRKDLLPFVQKFEIDHYFQEICGLQNNHADSKIEIGKCLMEKLNISPKEVILFGDTIHDYQTAQAMGTDCILIAAGHQTRQKLEKCGVPVLESLQELLEEEKISLAK